MIVNRFNLPLTMAAQYSYKVEESKQEEQAFDPNNPEYEDLVGLKDYTTQDVLNAICDTVKIPTTIIDVSSILTGPATNLIQRNDYIDIHNDIDNNKDNNNNNNCNDEKNNAQNQSESNSNTNSNNNNNNKNSNNKNNNNNNPNTSTSTSTTGDGGGLNIPDPSALTASKSIVTEVNLPTEIGLVIISYIKLPKSKIRPSMKIMGEIWVRCDSKEFCHNVAYMQVSYPWASANRKLNKEVDAYLEGLELWQRYRIDKKYDIQTIGRVLTDEFMTYFREIMKKSDNRAYKHKRNDLITLYKCYNLFSEGVSTRDIVSGDIKKENFLSNWDLYGDNIETLSHDLTTDDINKWRKSVDNIKHFKKVLLKEILDRLYPPDDPTTTVRRIHLSNDIWKDNVKYLYDMYVGKDAVLLQRVHSD